jgi:adenine deaminase
MSEALNKAALGMMVQVRQGSSERNLETLMPLLIEDRLGDWSFATDDILPTDIAEAGHINGLLRSAVKAGVPPARAIRHATLVPARHYGLRDRGAVAPGYRADLAAMANLEDFAASLVIHHGRVVARDGASVMGAVTVSVSTETENTIHVGPLTQEAFELRTAGKACRIIRLVPGQIVTQSVREDVATSDGRWLFAPELDVALVACVERHRASGKVGLGLVGGMGFRVDGALASSVAHDSHNLIIAGTNSKDMLACVEALRRIGGGFVAASGGRILADLPLPLAGLMSVADATTVRGGLRQLHDAATSLGCGLASPFAALSFLSLPVIPELRVTPRGLFDVLTQEFVDID